MQIIQREDKNVTSQHNTQTQVTSECKNQVHLIPIYGSSLLFEIWAQA